MLQRILVAAVGVPALLLVLCCCPAWATFVLLTVLSTIGGHELLCAVMNKQKAKRWWPMAGLLAICTLLCFGYSTVRSTLPVMPWLMTAFVTLLFICMIVDHGRSKAISFGDVCAIAVGGIAIPMALGCLMRLRLLEYGGGLVLIPLIAAFCSDALALFAGMLMGKHKLAPAVSPKKTREGAVGGLIGGMAGMVLYRIVFFLVTEVQLNIAWCLLLGVIGAAMGQLGDLSFSCIKREFSIKDYGRLLPGHGGVLDRFDSVIFAAPVIWMIMSEITLY